MFKVTNGCKIKYKNMITLFLVVTLVFFMISCKENNDSTKNVYTILQNNTNKGNNSSGKIAQITTQVSKVSKMQNTKASYSEEISQLIEAANKGDVNVQNTLAYYYFNGYGVEQDYKKSLAWSLKSAKSGNLASMFNVGYIYYHGHTGKVDYKLAFEWYKKAADKMFPKALNALGHMYYEGLGTKKDVDLAIDCTKQSAGFLHSYSLGNMGVLIDELNLNQDSHYWYRLAAKNYMMPNSSNERLYKKLIEGDLTVRLDYSVKTNRIPKSLIKDIFFKFYSGTLYSDLEKNNIVYKDFDFDALNIDKDVKSTLKPLWWYDTNYLIDIDGDSVKELLVFKLNGTMGISEFQVLKSVNDKYIVDEGSRYTDLMHGPTGIVIYENQPYFIVADMDIGDSSIFGVSIYAFDNASLSDSVLIEVVQKGITFEKTYQRSDDDNILVRDIEHRINHMFTLSHNSLIYHKANQHLTLDSDVNNNGDIEHYEYDALYYGTINRPLQIAFREDECDEKDLKIIDKALHFNDLATPIGLEMFKSNGLNYLGVLCYQLGTNNHCLTTYLLQEEKMTLIANHLISYDEAFIISENNSFFW